MKEIGEKLKENRKKNGVSLEEAGDDLNISPIELENLENGNFKAFKDVYELKQNIQAYAKYLGMNEVNILDDFNDYLFEKTSRISLSDIAKITEDKTKKESPKITSPYTNIKPSKYNLAPIALIIVLLMFISLIVYLFLNRIRNTNNISHELITNMEEKYEFT